MKKIGKTTAWYFDEDVLLEGYTDGRCFYPDSCLCGFDYQEFSKKDIGVMVFYSLDSAFKKFGSDIRIIKEDS